MPSVSLDFGEVGAMPDEGTYRVTCNKAIYKKNKTGDGFIINMTLALTDMEDERFENQLLWDNVSLRLSARWRLKEVLEAFTGESWDEDNMEIEVDDDGNVEALVDATAKATIYHEDYQGRIQLRVKNYYPDE